MKTMIGLLALVPALVLAQGQGVGADNGRERSPRVSDEFLERPYNEREAEAMAPEAAAKADALVAETGDLTDAERAFLFTRAERILHATQDLAEARRLAERANPNWRASAPQAARFGTRAEFEAAFAAEDARERLTGHRAFVRVWAYGRRRDVGEVRDEVFPMLKGRGVTRSHYTDWFKRHLVRMPDLEDQREAILAEIAGLRVEDPELEAPETRALMQWLNTQLTLVNRQLGIGR